MLQKKIFITIFLIILFSGCSSKTEINDSNVEGIIESNSYPSFPTAYPYAKTNQILDYPPPQIIINNNQTPNKIIPFSFNKPIKKGNTLITGSGPSNIPINIIDITLNGQIIGNTVIDRNGEFSIEVLPLESSHRIGILINSSDRITYQGLDYSNEGFQGSEPKQVPNIGYFFDTVLVE